MKDWSAYADDQLVDMADYLDGKDHNISDLNESVAMENKNAVDSFFLNEKHLDQTEQSFISIRPDARFSSKEDDDFNLKISARRDLLRQWINTYPFFTKHFLYFFIWHI